MPKISVIIPVYNGAKYIAETINSVLTQSLQDFELILLNDGSTDNSREVICAIKDKRINLHNQENKGLVATLNSLIKLSQGQYIARLDQDDIMQPNRLEQQLKALELEKLDAVYCNIIKFGINKQNKLQEWHNKDRQETDKGSVRLLQSKIDGCQLHSGLFAKKSLMQAIRYRADYYPCDDYDWQLRAEEKYKLAVLQEALIKYRFHESANTYAQFFIMQDKRRWTEHNQNLRLSGLAELSFNEFLNIDNSLYKNLNRKRKDIYKYFSRKGGQSYLIKNYFYTGLNFFMAGIFAPIKLIRRVLKAL